MNGGITSPSLLTSQKTMMWIGYFVFIPIDTSCGDKASQWLFSGFTMSEIFIIDGKKQSMFNWRWCLSLFKNFAAWSFLLSFTAYDKNCPFLNIWKYWMSSCITCSIRNLNTPISLAMNLIILPGSHQQICVFSKQSNWKFWAG